MLPTRTLLVLAALAALSFTSLALAGGPPPVVPGDLLGSTGARGASLISIDPVTGAGTTRFPAGSQGPVTEIRYSPEGTLYGTTGGGTSNLITIDPDTGTETVVANHVGGPITALEFVDGVFYGAQVDTAVPPTLGLATIFVEINPSNGDLTTLGTISGYSPVRGLAYDAGTGILYGAGTPTRAPDPDGISDELFTIDPANGATTPIGPTSNIDIGGMTFGPDGLLYGGSATGVGGDGGSAALVILDTATGGATVVGSTGAQALSGLAFVPAAGGGGEDILAIPTASEIGLLLLGALLAAAAMFVLRRG